MNVVVMIPSHLRQYSGEQARVALDGAARDVRAAMEMLRAVHPGVVARVLDEMGNVRPHVNIFVGTDNIRDLKGLDTPLKSPDEIFILPSVTGGC